MQQSYTPTLPLSQAAPGAGLTGYDRKPMMDAFGKTYGSIRAGGVDMHKAVRSVAAILFVLSFGSAQAAEDAWADFRFLIGEWVSDGKPEQGTGAFSLTPDLEGKILVRRNWAKLPAARGRPAGKHEDLMVIYREADGKQARADYYDSEGHVIRYAITASADKKELVFLSEAQPRAPRFRLTYTKGKEDTVAIKFEIAPPGKPEEFKLYLSGTVCRKNTAKKDN